MRCWPTWAGACASCTVSTGHLPDRRDVGGVWAASEFLGRGKSPQGGRDATGQFARKANGMAVVRGRCGVRSRFDCLLQGLVLLLHLVVLDDGVRSEVPVPWD